MDRELKRVPLDFDWPIGEAWYGYMATLCHEDYYEDYNDSCFVCKRFAQMKDIPLTKYGCPDFNVFLGPPKGDGYQLWETASDGSPASPVFATLDELCAWCEGNATTFADNRTTKERWKEMFEEDFVYHKAGNAIGGDAAWRAH